MNKVLDLVFKDAPLYKPVTDVMFCLVTIKFNGIERELTCIATTRVAIECLVCIRFISINLKLNRYRLVFTPQAHES